MFTKLTDINKAAIFTVLVQLMALTVALYDRMLGITSEFAAAWYMFTPTLAVLIMLLIVTRDGYSKEGWKTSGLHLVGLKAWWIAVLAPVLVGVLATATVWPLPSPRSSSPTMSVAKYATSSYSWSSSRSRFHWVRSSGGGATCSLNSCPWVGGGPWFWLVSFGSRGTCP